MDEENMEQNIKRIIADKLINKMNLTKEQYIEFCILANELGLELVD